MLLGLRFLRVGPGKGVLSGVGCNDGTGIGSRGSSSSPLANICRWFSSNESITGLLIVILVLLLCILSSGRFVLE